MDFIKLMDLPYRQRPGVQERRNEMQTIRRQRNSEKAKRKIENHNYKTSEAGRYKNKMSERKRRAWKKFINEMPQCC